MWEREGRTSGGDEGERGLKRRRREGEGRKGGEEQMGVGRGGGEQVEVGKGRGRKAMCDRGREEKRTGPEG